MSPGLPFKAALVVLFLAVQVAVPAVGLFAERPARFGWQMYANFPKVPEITIVADDASETPFDVERALAVARAEIDYAWVAAATLCQDGVAAVRISESGRPEQIVECP